MNDLKSCCLILWKCTSSICFTQQTHHVDSLEGRERGLFLYYPIFAFCDALSLSLYLEHPPCSDLKECVCAHEARWKPMQSHFKGRGKGGEGRRRFWQDGASWGICPLALGMVQMGTLSARVWTTCSGGKKEAYKSGFLLLSILTFIFLFFSFSPLILPAVNGKTNGIMSKSINASALQVQVIKSVSYPVCKHLVNICLPSHKMLWVAGKINKLNWLWSSIRHWLISCWNSSSVPKAVAHTLSMHGPWLQGSLGERLALIFPSLKYWWSMTLIWSSCSYAPSSL